MFLPFCFHEKVFLNGWWSNHHLQYVLLFTRGILGLGYMWLCGQKNSILLVILVAQNAQFYQERLWQNLLLSFVRLSILVVYRIVSVLFLFLFRKTMIPTHLLLMCILVYHPDQGLEFIPIPMVSFKSLIMAIQPTPPGPRTPPPPPEIRV